MNTIEMHNIVKSYDGLNNVLSSLNFTLDKGEFVSILGRSGAGKSTLLNIIGLLDSPTSGDYYLEGKAIPHKLTHKIRNEYFGFIYQLYNLLPNLTVYRNLMIPLLYSTKTIYRNYQNNLINITKKLMIANLLNTKVDLLSGGEKQRVAIARAMMLSPSVLIADEPTGSLDDENAERICNILRDYANNGNGVIVVTHNKNVAQYADNSYLLQEGKLTSYDICKM